MKTPIEMIDETWRRIDSLERRMSNIEQLLKELLNKFNSKPQEQRTQPMATIKVAEPPKMIEVSPPRINTNIETKPMAKIGDAPTKNVTQTNQLNFGDKVKVLGQIKNKDGRYVSGVKVKILDINNQIIKETKTNKAGEWMSLLPSGKYKAEYFLENIVEGSVNFNVVAGQTMIRVAQPKVN